MISPDSLGDKISRLVGRYRKFSKLSADYAHDIADCVENNEAELLAALRSSASARDKAALADPSDDELGVAIKIFQHFTAKKYGDPEPQIGPAMWATLTAFLAHRRAPPASPTTLAEPEAGGA